MSETYKPQIFISYSHLDEDFKDRLEKKLNVLKIQGRFDVWTDRAIGEGDKWLPEIEAKLNSCDVAILLISDNFLTSKFIVEKEVPLFLNRRENHGLKLYPLIVDDTPWQKVAWLAELAGAMKDNIPLLENKEQINKKLTDLVNRIDDYCQQCSTNKPNITDSSQYKKPFNVPFESKKDGAIGIDEKLQAVDKTLKETKKTAIGQVATFEGIGGLGKTQLVVEYAHRFKDSFDGVVWLTMDQDIDDQLMDLSDSVGWTQKDIDKQVKLDISREKFKALENTLLIYDNVENYEEIEPYIPKATNNFILITSRNIIKGFTSIPLAVLNEEHSLELLESESKRKIKDDELVSAKSLVEELDGLPLALEMAGAFVCEFDLSWDEYLENFLEEGVSFLDESEVHGWTKHESNISKTLHLSKEFLEKNPLLEEVLALIAWGASEPMDKELISQMLGVKPAKLVIALKKGIKLRLIKVEDGDEKQELYTLHRLVKEVWKKQKELDQSFVQKISQNLAKYMKDIKDEFLNFHKLDMASFQAKVWADRLEDNIEIKAVLMCYAVYPEYYMGEYREALKSVDLAYKIIKDSEDSDEYAEILNSIGFLLQATGKAERSKPYQVKALEMLKRLYLTENHPDVALSLNNLGAVLNTLKDKKGSKFYLEKAIGMYEQLYENKKSSGLARSFMNMGVTLEEYGDKEEIKYYCKKAIDILEQLYQHIDHPLLAFSLNNMGTVLHSLEDKKESYLYKNKALEMRKRLYSDRDHVEVALSLYNVGVTLLDLKQCIQAKDYFLQAKEMITRIGYDEDNRISKIVYYLGRVKEAVKKEKKLSYKKKGRFCKDT